MRTALLTSSAAALLAGTAFALPGVSSPNPVDVLAAKRAQAMIEQPSLFNSSVALRRDGYTSPVHNAGLLLSKRQESDRCGPDNGGQRCAGQRCCSFYGYCGTQEGYCSEFFCLPQFGWCTGQPIPSSAAPPVSTPAPPVSTPAPPVSTPATPPSSSAAAPPATPSSSTPATPPASGGNSKASQDGRCGPEFGDTYCPDQKCCSMYSYCGTGSEFCNAFGCQTGFGFCEGEAPFVEPAAPATPQPTPVVSSSSAAAPPPVASSSSSAAAPPPATPSSSTPAAPPASGGNSKASQDGRCGPEFGDTYCPGQKCCSMYSYCGEGTEFCNAFGCQTGFGFCEGEAPFVEPAAPATPQPTPEPETTPEPEVSPEPSQEPATPEDPVTQQPPQTGLTVSPDGRCGNGSTCAGSEFGNCCSKWYFCGGDEDYCMDDCRSDLGGCGAEAMPQPEPEPEIVYPPVSLSGQCGNGTSCLGSGFGDCCSYFYYCGYGQDYCGTNCRKDSGVCYG